ncbi:2-oxoacid:acceptor oxidoreductase family protein [Candidatus Gracilibacteria bacterium]|nr:2-oxoacid:acceptor oxidoreductase family protein [Candidatus Gracilibacteria bacterium]MCF7856450.1 2-oxoacid:acceptor oxidoreductase family protein [Candidatus Gracilibacteria bacterium]MCF7896555.1 2-oxoacid:acceptor oxidoreductase family protein [Candidatus Gracilibacteria bacterium]
MQKNLSIRWHSRAGQGAITASNALAEILGNHGKFVQSFPDFGAEKRGAPVVVFNRIANQIIEDVSHPTKIDIAVLLDPSLVSSCEITTEKLLEGLENRGILLVNSGQKKLKMGVGAAKVFGIAASEIAVVEIGKDIPNVPILGALVRILELAKMESFATELKKYLSAHLPPEIVEGNLKAFKRGFEEIGEIEGSKNLPKKNYQNLPNWKEITKGGTIHKSGSSEKYKTGNWVRQTCEWQKKTCVNCNLCWPVCPHDAIQTDSKGNMIGVDSEKCTACGLCVVACPTKPKSLRIISKKSSEI